MEDSHSFFLTEGFFVLFKYGWIELIFGIFISSVIVVFASRCKKLTLKLFLLGVATVVLWILMFAGVNSGYSDWQSIKNAPEDAFSDTSPIFFLLVGWLPALCCLCPLLWLLMKLKATNKHHNWRKPL